MAAAAARPARRSRKRTATVLEEQGRARIAREIVSTPEGLRLRGGSGDTDLCTTPACRTDALDERPLQPPLLIGKRQKPTRVGSVFHHLCSPYPPETIFLAWQKRACFLVGPETVSAGKRGGSVFHRVLVILDHCLRVIQTILIQSFALVSLTSVEASRHPHSNRCRSLFHLNKKVK